MNAKELLQAELLKRMGANESSREELKRMIGEQRKIAEMDPSFRTDYTPRAAFIDELTGSNLARSMERPESTQDALRKALAYRMQLPQDSISGLPSAIASLEKGSANKKLSGEQMKRLGSARMAAQALADIEKALEGKSAILPEFLTMGTGDTDFTEAARRFAEGFGRMQSGAAITADEETRFKRLLPRIQDEPEMRARKVAILKQEINARLKELGGDSSDNVESMTLAPSGDVDISSMNDEQLKKISGEDILKLTDEQLKRLLNAR